MVEARITLGDCLNLLDRTHFQELARTYHARVEALESAGVRIPVNTERGAHFLAREVIDEYCRRTARLAEPFQTVRGCFPEGVAVYPGSKILDKAHVQIAVRDSNCIDRLRLVRFHAANGRR